MGISTLLSYSLVKQDETKRYFSMHVLVHSWARNHISHSRRPCQLDAVKALLLSSISWRFLTEDYAFRRQLLPHVRVVQSHSPTKEQISLENIDDSSNFALAFYESGH
ncbi:hypothetical protein P152DRAFT_285175 [Eremomyces bilateralis CBS 781.70]|uniref:Uncharacterized protein n=1 Tax=Eremomyces bilateralis CBS 781.70 TaxID=1392243 RepID=A0A6G1FPW6_9PEZI|nr:uncharacterized protein P152DRAFT_285175 [Eremomyces bilateralis CBS 781.70]KAF1807875.1 hypothetical protein P152DRAFT_285175 [Eremomyces bilateralis CBS 781.70]